VGCLPFNACLMSESQRLIDCLLFSASFKSLAWRNRLSPIQRVFSVPNLTNMSNLCLGALVLQAPYDSIFQCFKNTLRIIEFEWKIWNFLKHARRGDDKKLLVFFNLMALFYFILFLKDLMAFWYLIFVLCIFN